MNSLSEEAGKDSLDHTLQSVDSQQTEVKSLESESISGSISESSHNQTPHDSSTADPAQEANESETKSEKNDDKQDPEAEKETKVELFMALFKGMTGPEWIEHIIDLTFVDVDLEKVPSLQLKDQKEQLRRFDSLPEETERVYAAFTAKLQSLLKGSNILVTSLFQKEEDSSSYKGEQVQLWPALNQALKHSKKADGEAEQEVLQWMTEMHEKEARLAKIATDIQINKELEERYAWSVSSLGLIICVLLYIKTFMPSYSIISLWYTDSTWSIYSVTVKNLHINHIFTKQIARRRASQI